jgi:hypothetical protein
MTKTINRDYAFKGNVGPTMRRQTVTAAAGAATKRGRRVQVTSEALTTAALAYYTLTLTNVEVKADSMVLVSIKNGTNTQGTPLLSTVAPAAGSVVVKVLNDHATEALNGTLVIDVLVIPNSTP